MADAQVPIGQGNEWTGWLQDLVGSAAKGYMTHQWGNNQPYMLDPATGKPYIPGQPTGLPSALPAVNSTSGMLMLAAVGVVVVFLLVK
jgi:hypothetical protein